MERGSSDKFGKLPKGGFSNLDDNDLFLPDIPDEDEEPYWKGGEIDPLIDDFKVSKKSGISDEDILSLAKAVEEISRVDEILISSSVAVQSAFIARSAFSAAVVSARIDGIRSSERKIMALDAAILNSEPTIEESRVLETISIYRSMSKRSAYHAFSAKRLFAIMRARKPSSIKSAKENLGEEWKDLKKPVSREEALDCLNLVFSRSRSVLRDKIPAISGARQFLAIWHEAGAAELFGGTAGRLLADAWMVREGFTSRFLPLSSWGFDGHMDEYAPWLGDEWSGQFFDATRRSAQNMRKVLDRAQLLHRKCNELKEQRRASPEFERVCEVIFRLSIITPRTVAEAAMITQRSAQDAISRIIEAGVIMEITDRERYRVWILNL